MVRNFTIALAIVASLFVGLQALPASALTPTYIGSDVQAQIDRLMAQIKELTSQLDALRSHVGNQEPMPKPEYPGVKHRICALLARDLAQGSRGDDVTGLQEFLRDQGFFSGNATGFFGPVTAQAVAKWQSQEGVTSVGSFGPLSRARLIKWCGGGEIPKERLSASPMRGDAPLTVTFNTWLSGFRMNTISYVINFGDGSEERATDCPAPADACTGPGVNTHTYANNGTYVATLVKITNTCPDGAQCFAAPMREVVGKVQITVGPIACTKEYRPVCGAKPVTCITSPCDPAPTTYGNKCEMTADNATFLYEGQCRGTNANPADDPQCKIWSDGCNTCSRQETGGPAMCTMMACQWTGNASPAAYCKAYFDSTTTNKPPTISGFSGPTTLSVNQSGTWSITANDPENGQLTYRVDWGDNSQFGYGESASRLQQQNAPSNQLSSLTHSYASAGTYTITIIVRDTAGKEAKTTTTVRVGGGDVVCTMEYAPVCAMPYSYCPPNADCQRPLDRTYSNRCVMNSEGATFQHEGPCTNGY